MEWFSIAELVGGILGMPASRRAVIDKAKRETWLSRERQGRGGGLEYHISSLPKETQGTLTIKVTNETIKSLEQNPSYITGKVEGAKLKIAAEASKRMCEKNRLESLMKSEGLPEMAKNRMNAKLEIIKCWETFLASAQESMTPSQFLFSAAYNKGEVEVPEWVRNTIGNISQPSLMKWLKTQKNEGITALSGRYGNKKGSGIFDANEALYNFATGMIGLYPDIDGKNMVRAIAARVANKQLQVDVVPSRKTVERFMIRWKNENKRVHMLMAAPDAYKNTYMCSFGDALESILKYLQQWEMDSTPTDVMLIDGRYTILGVIDVWSRRLKLLVSKTSKSLMVAALIRDAMLKWGVPECIKTDNGTDYTSKHVVGILQALEIEHVLCPPFRGDKKPFIERAFGTFSHDLLKLCPGFIGHNVADRKNIEARKSFAERISKAFKEKTKELIDATYMSRQEFQDFCDNWTDHIYGNECHRGLNGRTPAQMVNLWLADENNQKPKRIGNVRQLDYLLAEAPGNDGMRVVSKKGVSVDKFWFIAPELGAYIGDKVKVRYDVVNAGIILITKPDGSFICDAICPEIYSLGVSRAEIAVTASNIQKKIDLEKRKEVRKNARSANLQNIGKDILTHLVETGKGLPAIPELSNDSEIHISAALEAAEDAIIVREVMGQEPTFESINASAATVSPDMQRKLVEIISLDSRRESDEARINREKGERMSRYEALLANNFEGISQEDDDWRKSWENTPEHAAWKLCGNLYKTA